MKYFTSSNKTQNFRVRLMGKKEDEKEQINLASNLFNAEHVVSSFNHVIVFDSRKQFENFLFWREIFKQYGPTDKFSFFKYARSAAKIARDILNNQVIELDSDI